MVAKLVPSPWLPKAVLTKAGSGDKGQADLQGSWAPMGPEVMAGGASRKGQGAGGRARLTFSFPLFWT